MRLNPEVNNGLKSDAADDTARSAAAGAPMSEPSTAMTDAVASNCVHPGQYLAGNCSDSADLPTINVKQTLELLECPVCFDCMMPPVYQCREGHALCSSCLLKVKTCPTCRANPVDVRCRVLDRLAETIGEVRL